MSREIKFRAKRLDTGEWVCGYYMRRYQILEGKVCDIIAHEDQGNDGGYYIVDPTTVGQYTGLKDKNGREIYEGDVVVVRYLHGTEKRTVKNAVEFTDGTFHFGVYPVVLGDIGRVQSVLVLGNIHQNPELRQAKA